MKKHVVHIGLPRTATTFMQHRIFPEIPGWHYYGIPFTQIQPDFNRMMYADDSVFNGAGFNKLINGLPGEQVIISNENFSGQSMYLHSGNRTRIAKRLKEAMPEATVVLFLRNQPDLLKSLYLIALQDKETQSLDEFIRFSKPEYELDNYRNNPAPELFHYAPFDTYHSCEHAELYLYTPLVSLYKSLFKRVEIFLYEDFKLNPEAVLSRLESVFEIALTPEKRREILNAGHVNQGVNFKTARRLQKLNSWYPLLWRSSLGRAFYVRAKRRILNSNHSDMQPVKWSKEETDKMSRLFAADNEELNRRYPEIGLSNHRSQYLF